MGPLTCVSEVTNENRVTSPARNHATGGKRVFTGRVPTILNMAILPQCLVCPPPKFSLHHKRGKRAVGSERQSVGSSIHRLLWESMTRAVMDADQLAYIMELFREA